MNKLYTSWDLHTPLTLLHWISFAYKISVEVSSSYENGRYTYCEFHSMKWVQYSVGQNYKFRTFLTFSFAHFLKVVVIKISICREKMK